jgi:hypothetical protein
MELLAAVLTTVLVWVFALHLVTGARAAARKKAGNLLLKCRQPRWLVKRIAVPVMVTLIVAGAVALPAAEFIMVRKVEGVHVAFVTFLALIGATPWLQMRGLEFRERGMVRIAGLRTTFVPWTSIEFCGWVRSTGDLCVQLTFDRFDHAVAREQKEAITSTLSRLIPMYGANGALLNPHLSRPQPSTAGGELEPEQRRFQFSLRTLLLLTLLASSALSWDAVRHRRQREQERAIAWFDRFRPRVVASPSEVYLDFSTSPKKPSDADLSHLSALPELTFLNLCGAPITDAGMVEIGKAHRLEQLDLSCTGVTDAGLAHLEELKSLEFLSLLRTRVTDVGVRRLREALPNCQIFYGSSGI